MKLLISGNEAVARGAWEAGVKVACAYPGTPSTEILENLSKYPEVNTEWSTNEKVAFEVAYGAAIAGARSVVSMKHVGLNVAADPLFSSAYAGTKGGFVIISCDDPGMHSSQNEQDTRRYAKFAKIPIIEPSDAQEAYDFIKLAFEISEKFETPVLFRMSTRVSHTKGIVEVSERKEVPVKDYVKNPSQFILLPANARERHKVLEEKLLKLKEYSSESILNRIEKGKNSIGIVSSGVAYNYAKEVFKDAWFLKIGMPFPFPEKLFKKFYKKVKKIIVIEENEPFLEEEIKILGYKVEGKKYLPICDELNPDIVRKSIKKRELPHPDPLKTVRRPPQLCPGCPHTGVFYCLSKLKVTVTGDIGCYTLGALPPFNAMDTCICMGASIGNALGFEKARGKDFSKRMVAVIGDSTFLHSGVTGLINIAYNKGTVKTIILDNRTTAMTGHQDHPGTGKTAKGEKTKEINLKELAKACGIEKVYEVNPYDIKETLKTLKSAIESEEAAVIISRAPCALLKESREYFSKKEKKRVLEEKCLGEKCKACIRVGCPAISIRNGKAFISPLLCVGCDLCTQVCPVTAIV
ncbi:MAG: indolepyruvate ferredoxin oxidoreductase subunit alpha [Candidatus Hydrothermales bacterium]